MVKYVPINVVRDSLGDVESFRGGVIATVDGESSLFICTAEERIAELKEMEETRQILNNMRLLFKSLEDVEARRVMTAERAKERLASEFPLRVGFPFRVAPELLSIYRENLDGFANALKYGSCDVTMLLFSPFTTTPVACTRVATIRRTKKEIFSYLELENGEDIALFRISAIDNIWVVYDKQSTAPTNVLGFTNKNVFMTLPKTPLQPVSGC